MEYRDLVLSYGFPAGDLTNRAELQRLLAAFRGKPEEQALKIGLLKSLKRARYDTKPLGHYGLAKNNYTHFTSPIRRYADLVVHRTLADRGGKQRGRRGAGELATLAEHISTTERVAADAENESVKMKKLEFLQAQLTAENPRSFEQFARSAQLRAAHRATGRVAHGAHPHLEFERRFLCLRRRAPALAWATIEACARRRRYFRVIVARIDIFKQQADFAIVNEGEVRSSASRRRQSSRNR